MEKSDYSCIIIRSGVRSVFHKRGVADLHRLYHESPEMLEGVDVLDKVVGKGAAALMVAGKIARLQTPVISEPALRLLLDAGIEVEYGEKVPYIINRRGDGMCPLEQRCKDTDDISQLIGIIDGFVRDIGKQIHKHI